SDEPLDVTHLVDERNRLPCRCVPDAKGWVPHGKCAAFRDGKLRVEITYELGVAHGPYRSCWSNGRLSSEGQFVNGVQEGEWRVWRMDGTHEEVIQFKDGKEVVDWEEQFGRKFE